MYELTLLFRRTHVSAVSRTIHSLKLINQRHFSLAPLSLNMYKTLNLCEGKQPTHYVDLRSDTFTVPSEEMRKAMYDAEVGDDVVGEDPTINALQDHVAQTLGKEAALFTPSGTMSNLIAVMSHCNTRGSKVLIGHQSHIQLHEDGNVSELAGVQVHTIKNRPDGTFDIDEMERRMTSLVCIENTFNGCVLPLDFIDEVCSRVSRKNVPLHCDGARLFNAAVYLKVPASRLVQGCSSVSVCLSKGLGAPVGSLLVGSTEFIERARRLRHILGGAMRQVGVLGAPGRVALDRGVSLLVHDHRRMFAIASAINDMKSPNVYVDIKLVHTNMAFVKINPTSCTADDVAERLLKVTEEEERATGKATGIKCYVLDPNQLRFVTYNSITDKDVEDASLKLQFVIKEIDRMSC